LRRNCLLKHIIESKIWGGIEVTGRRGRRCKQLLDCRKKSRGYHWLKEEALDRSLWRTRIGRGSGSVVRQTTWRLSPLASIPWRALGEVCVTFTGL
jgi:hypothetical protein